MHRFKAFFMIASLILSLGVSKPEAKETAEYALNYEKTSVKNTAEDDERLLQLSEAFGHFIGKNLNNPGIAFDLERFIKGIRDGARGAPAPLSDEEYEILMVEFQQKALDKLSHINLEEAEAFLRDNLQKDDVLEIEKGTLQYQILKNGEGAEVQPDAAPLIHFTGKLMDGTLFASTQELGDPLVVPLTQTIRGFQLGIAGMKEGEVRRLFIHPKLGFPDSEGLPPNTLLIFDVEVVEANNPEENKEEAREQNSEDPASSVAEKEALKQSEPIFEDSAIPDQDEIQFEENVPQEFDILDEEFELPKW
jgi:peptidylprolyl isomerase